MGMDLVHGEKFAEELFADYRVAVHGPTSPACLHTIAITHGAWSLAHKWALRALKIDLIRLPEPFHHAFHEGYSYYCVIPGHPPLP